MHFKYKHNQADLQAAFRNKIGKESPPRVILGACNPKLAYEILGAVPAAALMLPCNVVVESLGDDKALVSISSSGCIVTVDRYHRR